MNALGSAALVAALLTAIYAVVAALIGTRGDRRWVISARRAIYAMFGLLILTVVALESAFLRTDLTVGARRRPLLDDDAAALQADGAVGQPGRLAAALGVRALDRLLGGPLHHPQPPSRGRPLGDRRARRRRRLLPRADGRRDRLPRRAELAVRRLQPGPRRRAQGLTPLLRHPAMAIHPPMLYSGYVFFTIPFAFAIGALITRRLDASWIRSTRRFALIAWLFLTIGIALGARWSYSELGWGGYWAWDPVENAALIPWLAGTRLPALDHGPGAPRHAPHLERLADLRRLRALAARHVPRPLRDPAVDPRLRRVQGRAAAARADRPRRDRLDDPDRQPPRVAALGAPARLGLQPRVGLPASTTCCSSASPR